MGIRLAQLVLVDNFKTGLKIAILLATAVVTVATSKSKDYPSKPLDEVQPATVQYTILSTCAGAPSEQEDINVVEGQITLPATKTFKDYGLPTQKVVVGENSSTLEQDGGTQRNCYYSLQQYPPSITVHTYICYENNQYVCHVMIQDKIDTSSGTGMPGSSSEEP